MPTRLNARQISVFSAVMRLGGASAASEFLNISQPAISKTLALMEAEIGYELFRRTGRGLKPTAEALALRPHVDRVLTEFDRLQSNAAVIGHGLTGTLSIGGNHTLISQIATTAATGLRSRHPETGLRLLLTPAGEVIESVLQHKIDVGLIYGPISTTQVTTELLCSWSCSCVFPAGHRFSKLDKITVDELRGESILTYSDTSPTGQALRALFAESPWPIEPAISFGDTFTLLEMVRRGVGVGLVDTFDHFRQFFPEIRSLPMFPKIELNAMLVVSNQPTTNPALPLLLDEIRSAARANNL